MSDGLFSDPPTDLCACDYRLLADTVETELNPPDSDDAEVSICTTAVERIAAFVRALPCACKPGPYDGPCGRCTALGQWCGEPVER